MVAMFLTNQICFSFFVGYLESIFAKLFWTLISSSEKINKVSFAILPVGNVFCRGLASEHFLWSLVKIGPVV